MRDLFAVVLLAVCQLVFFAGLSALVYIAGKRWIQGAQDRITRELLDLTEGKPCKSAAIINAVGAQVGAAAGRSAKASFMADLSHARTSAESAAVDQVTDQVGDRSPALGAALTGMGKKQTKGLLNNPIIQLALQGFLNGGVGSGSGSGSNHGGKGPPKSFTL